MNGMHTNAPKDNFRWPKGKGSVHTWHARCLNVLAVNPTFDMETYVGLILLTEFFFIKVKHEIYLF